MAEPLGLLPGGFFQQFLDRACCVEIVLPLIGGLHACHDLAVGVFVAGRLRIGGKKMWNVHDGLS